MSSQLSQRPLSHSSLSHSSLSHSSLSHSSLSHRALSRRSLLIGALLSALSLSFMGCMLPTNDSPSAPRGRLQVIHANPQEAPVEVLLNGERLLTVASGELSEVVGVEQGEWSLELRREGTTEPYMSTELIPFGDDMNVLALALSPEGQSEVIYVTDPLPAPEEGTHHVRVLDVSELSAFIATEPGTNESYSLADVASSAPLHRENETVDSPLGGVSLVVVQAPNGEAASYKVTTLQLR
jgi:hypothetical protein